MEKEVIKVEKWSEGQCLAIASLDNFPAAVKDLTIQKNIISHYLNFYLGGKVQKGLSARDLTLAVIAIMPISPTNEDFIWPEKEYSATGNLFFLTPDDRLKHDIDYVFKKRIIEEDRLSENSKNKELDKGNDMAEERKTYKKEDDIADDNSDSSQEFKKVSPASDTDSSDIEEDLKNDNMKETNDNEATDSKTSASCQSQFTPSKKYDLQWYRLKNTTTRTIPAVLPEYSPVDNANFCTCCNYHLGAWESSIHSRISLKYFFAMVALFTMRARAKSLQNLTKYFNHNIREFQIFKLHYSPPHRGFLKKSWKTFHITNRTNQIMYAKLIITSLVHPNRLGEWEKTNIIKYALLTHLAYYNMGIISMLQQLAIYNKYFVDFFTLLHTDETAASWDRVDDFFQKYLNKEAKQYTFHWAGVIDSKLVEHLSCHNNYELAVVVAVLIEKETNKSGIWQASWVNRGSRLEEYKQLGEKIYKDMQKMLTQKLQLQFRSLLL